MICGRKKWNETVVELLLTSLVPMARAVNHNDDDGFGLIDPDDLCRR